MWGFVPYNNNSNNNNFSFSVIIILLLNFKKMYIIYRNIWSKNQALYNIKNYINHKNSDHCVNNDFANTFLAAHMQSVTLAGSPEF